MLKAFLFALVNKRNKKAFLLSTTLLMLLDPSNQFCLSLYIAYLKPCVGQGQSPQRGK